MDHPSCIVDDSDVLDLSILPDFSVIIPVTKEVKSHFHILVYLKGHHCTTKVAAMVNSGAIALFIDHK